MQWIGSLVGVTWNSAQGSVQFKNTKKIFDKTIAEKNLKALLIETNCNCKCLQKDFPFGIISYPCFN